MKRFRLEDMERGWFVGDFSPSCLRTRAAEAAVKTYRKGDRDELHYHKAATEVTLLLSGSALLNGRRLRAGDIVVLGPGEAAEFRALSAAKTVVIKVPGAKNDKYPGRPAC